MSAESEAASKAARRVRRGNQKAAEQNRRNFINNRPPEEPPTPGGAGGGRRQLKGAASLQYLAQQTGSTGNLFGKGSRANRKALRAAKAGTAATPTVAKRLQKSNTSGLRGAARRRQARINQILNAPAGGATGQRR